MLRCRAALEQSRAQTAGTLPNVSSLLGLVASPLVPVYVVSKFAIRGLSVSLRQLVAGQRNKVCAVRPGPIDTPAAERAANHTGRGLRSIPPPTAPNAASSPPLSPVPGIPAGT